MINNYLELLSNKEQDIQKVRDYLNDGSLLSLTKIFSEETSSRGHLYHYLENTQDLLSIIVDKLQNELLVGDFYLDKERSVTNSSSLILKRPKFHSSFAYISLNSKRIYHVRSYKKNIFNAYNQIYNLEKEIEKLTTKIQEYDIEFDSWKKSSKLKLKFKRIKEDDFDKVDKYINRLRNTVEDYKAEVNGLKERVKELENYQEDFLRELRRLSVNLVEIGFVIEYDDLDEEKNYYIYNKSQDNLHYSGETSYSQKSVCILNNKDYDRKEVLSEEVMTMKEYTKEQLDYVLEVLNDIGLFKSVEMTEEDELELNMYHKNGLVTLSSNGTLTIKGENLSLFDVIHNKKVLNAICVQ